MSIKNQIRSFIEKNFIIDNDIILDEVESLLEAGIIDSTSVLELISYIEDEFDISVDDNEIVPDNFDSLEKIAKYVESKIR